MSIPVALERIRSETLRFTRAPYLITVSDEGGPHAVAIAVTFESDRFTLEVGRRSAHNARVRPQVSLLWVPNEPGGYSLIVDGTAASVGEDGRMSVSPERAVLHRPAAAPDSSKPGCSADCVPILR